MKFCLCGFVEQDVDEEKEYEPINRNNTFIRIKGSFMVETWDKYGDTDGVEEVGIYACPKCGTLQMMRRS